MIEFNLVTILVKEDGTAQVYSNRVVFEQKLKAEKADLEYI